MAKERNYQHEQQARNHLAQEQGFKNYWEKRQAIKAEADKLPSDLRHDKNMLAYVRESVIETKVKEKQSAIEAAMNGTEEEIKKLLPDNMTDEELSKFYELYFENKRNKKSPKKGKEEQLAEDFDEYMAEMEEAEMDAADAARAEWMEHLESNRTEE